MRNEEWKKVEELLDAALELGPRERRRLLDEACAGAPDLRREVESLLACEGRADGFLDAPALAFSADFFDGEPAGEARAGQAVGHYRVIREIGRGGMGAVFLAERSDGEFRQEVALKVVRRIFAGTELARRFRRERQILASLNHPNIARLLDGGVSADGEPFLAMEYVEGVRIDEYADARRLTARARLELFRQVCAAVQYAHQNLVIHRDLKPSNILVTKDGVPKLLDFGIAKLLDPEGEDAGAHTLTEMGVMTPEYASPEQVRGESVTTASDVYSLGVVLYELLSGRRPYRVRSRKPDEIARAISEQEPERPSAAVGRAEDAPHAGGGLSAPAATPEAVGRARGEQPERLRRRLAGDLDNIVLMAMRKEPARRYASVGQFSEDIRRHLDGLPVIARKDTFKYRGAKFVRRNRLGVAAAALAALTLICGVVAVAWQASAAREQARVAARERDRARREAAKAERINTFLQNVLGFSDASWISSNPNMNREATIADALDEAGRRAETELADQPEVQAAVRFTLGWTYKTLSKLDTAEPHLRASLELRRLTLGSEHQDTAQSMVGMGELHMYRGQFAESEALFREAVAVYRRAHAAGAANEKWFAISLSDLGYALSSQGDTAAGEASFREALEVGANLTGADRGLRAVVHSNIGATLRERGDLDGAVVHIEKGLEEYRRLPGGVRWEMGAALGNLAGILTLRGEYDRAEPLARESLDVYRATVGETHAYPPRSFTILAEIYCGRGDYGRAIQEAERAAAIQRRVLAESHIDFARTWVTLGKILTRAGQPARGETYLRQAAERRARMLKPGHWMRGEAQGALGECLTARGRYAEAEPPLVESHDTLAAALGQSDPRTQEARRRLVALYEAWRKPEQAARFSRP